MEESSYPKFNETKTTDAAMLFIDLAGGSIAYIKLLKLLYLADREALELWERPISHDTYFLLQHGPVLSVTYDLIKGRRIGNIGNYWAKNIKTSQNSAPTVELRGKLPDHLSLSRRETSLIRQLHEKFCDYKPFELVRFTHTLPEYHPIVKGKSSPLPLTEILRVLNYEQSDIERISAELIDEAIEDVWFGG